MLFRRVPKKTEPKMKSIDWFRDPFSYPTQILCWSRVNRTHFKPTAAEKFEWKRFNILIEFAYIIHRLLVEFEFEFVSENNWPASSRRLTFANDTVCEVAVQNINETLNTFKCGHRKEQPTHSLMSFASVFHMPSVLCEVPGRETDSLRKLKRGKGKIIQIEDNHFNNFYILWFEKVLRKDQLVCTQNACTK